MNKSLQSRFREIIHNNYPLYYFAYTQHKYAMKTHSSGVFPDGCSDHLPREILTTYTTNLTFNLFCVIKGKLRKNIIFLYVFPDV
jgi:hypothetical protein